MYSIGDIIERQVGSRMEQALVESVESRGTRTVVKARLIVLDEGRVLKTRRVRTFAVAKADDGHTPPQAVRAAAKRAVAWIEAGKAGDGFTAVGRGRARDLAAGKSVSLDTVQRIANFLSRHEGDKKATGFNQGEKGYPSAGRVSWDAWGGDAAKSWAAKTLDQVAKQAPEDASPRTTRLIKQATEERFTLAPWYIPDKYDAQNEWTDARELQKALWDYVRGGDRTIRLQHDTSIKAGEWVEAMTLPHEWTTPVQKSNGATGSITYPSGTVLLGVVWEPWAWEMVKSGEITGFSIGGSAERIDLEIPN